MTFIEIAHFALGEDLEKLAAAFRVAKIPYRIFERDGQQVVVVIDASVSQAQPLLKAYNAGTLPDTPKVAVGFKTEALPLATLLNTPVTIILIALSILGFILLQMQWWGIIHKLVFQPTFIVGSGRIFGSALDGLSRGEVWRLITPIFLHFGALHLVFNCLWCWELGRRIELVESSQSLLIATILIGVGANVIHYAYSGSGLFGGLSGVIYGLLAYCAVSQWLHPASRLALNPLIYVIMLVFLVLGMSGLMSFIGFGAIANAAHLGGLLSGAIWALIVRQFNLFS